MAREATGERDWWLRTLLVLQAPRAVFTALRDDTSEAAAARSEPVAAITLLAGIAGVLATNTAGQLLDDGEYDALLIAVWAFVAGGAYGVSVYWVVGWLLHRGLIALGSAGSYRRARHVLAFAAVPVVFSLVLLPVKLSLYGADMFRGGGSDEGAGGTVFAVLQFALFVWAAVLVPVGVRAVHGWSWARSAAAVAAAAVLPLLLTILVVTSPDIRLWD